MKFSFWATDEVEIKEEVVALKIPSFANDEAKEAYVRSEWRKWASVHFGDEHVHGGWKKATKRRWFN